MKIKSVAFHNIEMLIVASFTPLGAATCPLSPEHRLNSSDGGAGARSVGPSLSGADLKLNTDMRLTI